MKILLLAPHPFYQDRGTPIAVDLLVKTLSDRGDHVDLLTFHEGEDKHYKNVKLYRINPVISVKGISPGFSAKKLYCDLILFFKMISLLNSQSYDLVHAVEESATLAMLYKPFSKVPYIYDMDSVITEQLIEKSKNFQAVVPMVRYFESSTIKNAQAVVAVCQAIADYAHQYKDENIYLLKDISLISNDNTNNNIDNLRALVAADTKIGLYIGNLESYQGIDLLLDALSHYIKKNTEICLLIIGGKDNDIEHYTRQALKRGLSEHIKFLGPRPIADMGSYMTQADFLLSPRTKGINTPMKIYSYLGSGVPVLATALATHTQVMSHDIAYLCNANGKDFADAIDALISNPTQAQAKASKAVEFIQAQHSMDAFRQSVERIYNAIENDLSRI